MSKFLNRHVFEIEWRHVTDGPIKRRENDVM